jgi:hypothetical protein
MKKIIIYKNKENKICQLAIADKAEIDKAIKNLDIVNFDDGSLYKEISKEEYEKKYLEKPKITNIEKRKQEYSKEISNSDFQEAYFEKEFEDKPEKLKALQEKRLQIKNKYPKK